MNKLLMPLLMGPAMMYATDRPNIILFMVDDMGWQDTSVPFWTQRTHYNDTYNTPNMERLAAQGMMFTQAYASAISSPSRCSLLTGVNAPRHRVTNWTLQKGVTTDAEHATLMPPQWNVNGIAQAEGTEHTFVATSFVQILKDNGYHTIHCGKAHFGALDTPGENPHHFGFEVNIAGHAAGGLASYLGEQNYGNTADGKNQSLFAVPDLEKYWGTETFVTEALTLEAIKALDKANKYNQPFFLYMSHYAVHVPYDRDMRFYQSYIDKGLPVHEAAYASLVEGMDKSLGDIMNWLDANNLSDNTIIIFMSDNGGYATSNAWRDGQLYVQNFPLSSGKGSLYEGGVREPMIVSWPGVTAHASRCNDIVAIEDFYPSILEMAAISNYQTGQTLDGRSFVPELRGEHCTDERTLYWNYPHNWGNDGPGINFNCAIRQGDWKLIYYYESGKKELFNITNDIGEKNNLAESYPQKTVELSRQLAEYLRSCNADRPLVRKTNLPCPWPDQN